MCVGEGLHYEKAKFGRRKRYYGGISDQASYRFLELHAYLDTFKELVELVRCSISKRDTKLRRAISAEDRTAVTLRYLATARYVQSNCMHELSNTIKNDAQ